MDDLYGDFTDDQTTCGAWNTSADVTNCQNQDQVVASQGVVDLNGSLDQKASIQIPQSNSEICTNDITQTVKGQQHKVDSVDQDKHALTQQQTDTQISLGRQQEPHNQAFAAPVVQKSSSYSDDEDLAQVPQALLQSFLDICRDIQNYEVQLSIADVDVDFVQRVRDELKQIKSQNEQLKQCQADSTAAAKMLSQLQAENKSADAARQSAQQHQAALWSKVFQLQQQVADSRQKESEIIMMEKMLLDPMVGHEFNRLKGELKDINKQLIDTKEQLKGVEFTAESRHGTQLVTKCTLLMRENEELSKKVHEGRVAQLSAHVQLMSSYNDELKKCYLESEDLRVAQDEENERLTMEVFKLQSQLKHMEQQVRYSGDAGGRGEGGMRGDDGGMRGMAGARGDGDGRRGRRSLDDRSLRPNKRPR